jgi:two-component system, LytTR family, sensor kinase
MAFLQLCTFYSSLFVLIKFKGETVKDWYASIGRLLLSFIFIVFLNYWRGRIAARFDVNLHPGFYLLILDTIRTYWGYAFYAIGYYFITRSNLKEKQLRQVEQQKATAELAAAQLEAKNAQAQQALLEMELNFLRAQINPHFLYNTLNVFYTQVQPLSPPLAKGLLTLSQVMRYSLETVQGGQLVPLKQETINLQRVISIHQLRFNQQLQIDFTIEGPYSQVQVAPLLFITLLENALKHGVANDPTHPIVLWLSVDATHIHFTIRNQKNGQPHGSSSGIGMENLRSRLQAVYGSRYLLSVEETDHQYHVGLAIEHGAAPATPAAPADNTTLNI